MVLDKELNFRLRKPHYVQEFKSEDCDRRKEYGELLLTARKLATTLTAVTGHHVIQISK